MTQPGHHTDLRDCFRRETTLGIGVALLVLCGLAHSADPSKRFVYPGEDGRLHYDTDTRGNRIPDFSHCGYRGGNEALPDAPVKVVVTAKSGDATARLQQAIDYVAQLPQAENGVRGAVLIVGRHEIAGQLTITTSGVVLRGTIKEKKPATLVATGLDRRSLIRVFGKADWKPASETVYEPADSYVPVGTDRLKLKSTEGLQVGDSIRIEHPSTREWIAALGMDRFPTDNKGSWLDWKPRTRDLVWVRTIQKITREEIILDAPLTSALDAKLSTCRIIPYTWPGRVHSVGIENLRLETTFNPKNALDEEHAWEGVVIENARDCWVRQLTFNHFAGSVVALWESCQAVTVQDCQSEQPISEVGGWRRRTFFTAGQQTLFQRCRSEGGHPDFSVGHLSCGPNAFVECQSTDTGAACGPLGSWASGVLWDNVKIDGHNLELTNRETEQHGVGWSAANCVLWQCTAPKIICRTPPTAQNWAIGLWGHYVGDGHWRDLNQFVKPDSLFRAQHGERLGKRSEEILKRRSFSDESERGLELEDLPHKPGKESVRPLKLELQAGQLLLGGKPFLGTRTGVAWWRGEVLPAVATEVGLGVTRFVPGRVGPGYTDILDELTEGMKQKGQVVLEHHWGLWYDRRRDDHQMLRRADAEVWAPFYELPWARSGKGKAWDGLSRYDLTRFNPWYFSRLQEFAQLCERKGLLLVQQMYFQHNILEAGAHWADFPWRPANCLQDTGFPEPPPYVGNKRIFMAEAFYDITHPARRDLHKAYIRHCLDTLSSSPNVLFQTGEEFTGPLSFVEFWVDTIAEWRKETGKRILVGLSCTKDVQDAVLSDPKRASQIDVIDLRYWWYTANGGLYDPKGGENLAPRQQYREWKGSKTRSEDSLARQIVEYRRTYPEKAVTTALDGGNPWFNLCAGATITAIPGTTDPQLLSAVARMKPLGGNDPTNGSLVLGEPGSGYLIYLKKTVALDLKEHKGAFVVFTIDPKTGKAVPSGKTLEAGKVVELTATGKSPEIVWLKKP